MAVGRPEASKLELTSGWGCTPRAQQAIGTRLTALGISSGLLRRHSRDPAVQLDFVGFGRRRARKIATFRAGSGLISPAGRIIGFAKTLCSSTGGARSSMSIGPNRSMPSRIPVRAPNRRCTHAETPRSRYPIANLPWLGAGPDEFPSILKVGSGRKSPSGSGPIIPPALRSACPVLTDRGWGSGPIIPPAFRATPGA